MANSVLFCATVDYHFKAFHLPYMKWFKEQGWQVDVAAAGTIQLPYTDHKYNISIERSPFHRSNLKAYRQLKRIIDSNEYDIIHCHTPLGGVLTRLAARKARKYGTKVVYTAHGFHFCKGAPLANWLLYYPMERLLARYTDTLITINHEDFNLATTHNFKAKSIKHVHGVGVDTNKFKPISDFEQIDMKKISGYLVDDFLLFYAAEFNRNKNQEFLIRVLAQIKDDVPNAVLILAGDGPLLNECKALAEELGVSHMIDFLGLRKDINQILPMCDVVVASSLREGLPVNIMEAMACGVPVVALENRGHNELITNDRHGWVVAGENIELFASKLLFLARESHVGKELGSNGRKDIVDKYSIHKVLAQKKQLYQSLMTEQEESVWAVQ
ncbi:glycosyltransferase family 4 protein [Ornithinibacillus californiensis]|uniref:glycosyltransferase family 4 protein n=1 Tax=Ornithinibacillus californiensis TaxID=161536 RepID=UPI00064E0033|nr:glycosyltransferase family 4 protein [Ornithinibacillus californiensis]